MANEELSPLTEQILDEITQQAFWTGRLSTLQRQFAEAKGLGWLMDNIIASREKFNPQLPSQQKENLLPKRRNR